MLEKLSDRWRRGKNIKRTKKKETTTKKRRFKPHRTGLKYLLYPDKKYVRIIFARLITFSSTPFIRTLLEFVRLENNNEHEGERGKENLKNKKEKSNIIVKQKKKRGHTVRIVHVFLILFSFIFYFFFFYVYYHSTWNVSTFYTVR